MTAIVYPVLAAAALVSGGWLASAWYHRRQLAALQLQLRLVRQTHAEHAAQARRQIGQLQAELAARPPRPPGAETAEDVLADGFRRKPAVPDRYGYLEDGFAQTAIVSDGFAQTHLMR